MTELFHYKTVLRPLRNRRDLVRAEVTYVQMAGNREPHFSITGTTFSRTRRPHEERVTYQNRVWWADGCGCIHREIAEAFPELAPFIPWHLAGPSGPMHYEANALWHMEELRKLYATRVEVLDRVLSHRRGVCRDTLLGLYGDDPSLEDLLDLSPDTFAAWVTARLPRLQASFQEALVSVRALERKLTCPTPSAKTKNTAKRRARTTSTSDSCSPPSATPPS